MAIWIVIGDSSTSHHMKPKTRDLWSSNAAKRVAALKMLEERERGHHLDELLSKSHHRGKWPFGMPTSISPWLVLIGVSPGKGEDDGKADRYGERPSFWKPNYSFGGPYSNPANPPWDGLYWKKVRALCFGLIGSLHPGLTEADCLSVSGHLNLGIRNQGRGTEDAIDPRIAEWVPKIITTMLRPRVVIGFGLKGLLNGNKLRTAWGSSNEFSVVVSKRPRDVIPFEGNTSYKFRIWDLPSGEGSKCTFVLWPNHPSRVPFSGSEESIAWQASIKQCLGILSTA